MEQDDLKERLEGISRILMKMGEAKVNELDPYGSLSYCSRCGWENKT
ncbi:MAG: hypothetical protein RXR18_06160 [Nitrososphaeria archaeon]